MNSFARVAVAGVLFSGSFHTVNASTVDAADLLRDYNLITVGDANVSSHVDGKSLIGGNLSGGGDFNLHVVTSTAPALTVAGNIASGSFNVNGSGLHVGGTLAGTVNLNGGGGAYVGSVATSGFLQNNANGTGTSYVVGDIAGTVNTNSGSTVYGGNLTGTAGANGGGQVRHEPVTRPFQPAAVAADAASRLAAYSGQLSGIAANGTYGTVGNKVTFTAAGSGQTTFEIADADSFFANASEFEFNLSAGENILVNVRGADSPLNVSANFLGSTASLFGRQILWNFVDATAINFNSQFGGSVLALFADVNVGQNVEGTLAVSRLLQQSGEIHYQPLDPGFPKAVPLPGAAPLLAAALAGIGGVACRRRR